jgi:hypothetical protein
VPGAGIAADKPNPQPLWNAYPLSGDQGSPSGGNSQNAATTTTTSPQSAEPAASTNTQPVTVTDTAGDGPPWALMIVAAAGGALLVVVLLMLQGRRSRRREEALVGAADEWPWLASSHSNGTGDVRAARLRAANGAAAEFGTRPSRGAERAAEPASNGSASEWVADRDRGVEAEREMGVAPAEGAAAERVAEPQPVAGREPVANGAAPEWGGEGEPAGEPEPVAEAEEVVDAEPVADAEPEPVTEAEPVAEAEPEPVAEAALNGAAADHGAEELAAPANGHVEHDAQRVVERQPGFEVVEASEVPRQRFDRAAGGGKPASSRHGPICQVRWSVGAKCLFAVASDANGVEHRIAWSPPITWGKAGPPDEDSREARAALRVLAKDLRDKGWRPMRAKGDDFDETRWYARRFRFPVAADVDDPAPWQHGPPAGVARADQ